MENPSLKNSRTFVNIFDFAELLFTVCCCRSIRGGLALRLLHPVMPFITEELWQQLTVNTPARPKSIALSEYPEADAEGGDADAERVIGILQDLISTVRNLRAEMNVSPKEELLGTVYSDSERVRGVVRAETEALARMAGVRLVTEAGAAGPDQR